MARSAQDLERLVAELASLSPRERDRVLGALPRNVPLSPLPRRFRPPVLAGGRRWIGGDLRREDIYDDDGR